MKSDPPRNAGPAIILVEPQLGENIGTAARAMSLGRHDLAGKTGTTNDFIDAWFNGYQPGLVGIAWVGFDQPRKLGSNETGSLAALPIWIEFMRKALVLRSRRISATSRSIAKPGL